MSEGRDPAIKLFGKTIQLPDGVFSQDAVSGDGGVAADGSSVKSEDRSSSASSSSEVGEERQSDDNNKDQPEEKTNDKEEKTNDKEENRPNSTVSEEVTEPNATSMISDNTKTPSSTDQNESATAKASKSEEEQSEMSNNNQEKTLKKPDKILPCPRCNSMDTKFCYYNNYNVNQPRHFCKNCQRYWTAGGTMRNVPVGAGRRKNKTSASQYRQITVTEALPIELNHTVLKFGSSDTPLCESMASVLKIADKNGFRKPEELIIPVSNDDNTNRPSPEIQIQNRHGFSPQMPPCFPGAPWPPYPWTPQMGPAFCPPAFPMPFYPGPYWGCAVPVPVPGPGPGPGPWWVSPPANYHVPPPPPLGPISPTLGKHSREENIVKPDGGEDSTKENEPEKSLWVPKTLRIDDPDEAAKSSIWATLGIKNDRSGGIFKAFQSKNEEKKQQQIQETSPALQANPAALSRSLNFQESS